VRILAIRRRQFPRHRIPAASTRDPSDGCNRARKPDIGMLRGDGPAAVAPPAERSCSVLAQCGPRRKPSGCRIPTTRGAFGRSFSFSDVSSARVGGRVRSTCRDDLSGRDGGRVNESLAAIVDFRLPEAITPLPRPPGSLAGLSCPGKSFTCSLSFAPAESNIASPPRWC
jgi:hypothetical protein